MIKISGSILAILVPTWSIVQAPPPPPPPTPAVAKADQLIKSDTLIGMTVIGPSNQQVGKVSDLAVDLEGGRIAELLVDTRGGLTSKHRTVAVPPEAFSLSTSGNELSLSGDIDAFEDAPEFHNSTWNNSTANGGVADVYERFHESPPASVGPVKRATHLTGKAIKNQSDQHVGKLESLIVALPSGKIPDVIVATSGFFGAKEELTAVPPQGFFVATNSDAVFLDTSKESLRSAPHFKSDEWRRIVGESEASGDAPAGIAQSQSDIEITQKIETKFLAADGLSANARLTQVITRNGEVTLRGVAESLKEKARLGDIAATVVPAEKVNNQVEVKALAIAGA